MKAKLAKRNTSGASKTLNEIFPLTTTENYGLKTEFNLQHTSIKGALTVAVLYWIALGCIVFPLFCPFRVCCHSIIGSLAPFFCSPAQQIEIYESYQTLIRFCFSFCVALNWTIFIICARIDPRQGLYCRHTNSQKYVHASIHRNFIWVTRPNSLSDLDLVIWSKKTLFLL